MAAEKHDTLETWQLAVGLATALIGLLYYARKAPATAPESGTAPVGPAGFGEVPGFAGGGGGGGGSWPTPGQPASPTLTGQQSPPPEPKPLAGPAPGEGQAEWERSQHPDFNPELARRLGEGEVRVEQHLGPAPPIIPQRERDVKLPRVGV